MVNVVPEHAGLELGLVLSQIPKGEVEMLIDIVREYVQEHHILMDTEVHGVLLGAIEDVETQSFSKRQRYFKALFAACVLEGVDSES